MSRQVIYNLVALLTVAVWGVTFISTKVLISHGLTPVWIFITRFAIAYLCVLTISHAKFRSDSIADELYMLAMGLTGGSLYFIAENTALEFTFASNVSLIICATPVLTMMLARIIYGHRIRVRAAVGSLMALGGVAIVILNGSLNFGLNPAGDLLTLLAALFWAIYCMLLKKMNTRYTDLFITRKVFFYGCLSALIYGMLFETVPDSLSVSAGAPVILNLLFLAVVASFLCYIAWNKAVRILGPEKTSNYIYFTPMVTILASSAILGEPVTLWLLLGGAIIILGVYLTASASGPRNAK